MLIPGHCHCQNIAFTLRWEPDPAEIPARACGCSFCTRHGAVWTASPDAVLEVELRDPARAIRYAFGTRTADFHVCGVCGGVPLATSPIEGRLYAVVNVHTFEGPAVERLRPAPVTFEGETQAVRLARRQRSWIGQVAFKQP